MDAFGKRMRIGVRRSPSSIADGGVYQYEEVFLKALAEIAPGGEQDFDYLFDNAEKPAPAPFKQEALETYLTQTPRTPAARDPNVIGFDTDDTAALQAQGIDLVLLLSPHRAPFVTRIPYVMPIFDLNHRLQPEFAEVSAFGAFNLREHLYINACRYATFILVDSETGKRDVLQCYGDYIGEERVRVLPYYPPIERRTMPDAAERARVVAKYNLPPRFFFYPAQFWAHKNHASILRALKLIESETREKIPVIFCGAYADYFRARTFMDLRVLAGQLGVADRIGYLGVVPAEDIPALYALSAGLVMPSFFGPTNLPPLEAWSFGKPVIVSDNAGMREQVGDAGLFADPRSPSELARAMSGLWRDDLLAADLAARGSARLARYSWRNYVDGIAAMLHDACARVRSGEIPRFPA